MILSYVVTVESKVKISQNFVAFSEYMNFTECHKIAFQISGTVLNRAMKARIDTWNGEKWQAFLHELLITLDNRVLLSKISIELQPIFFCALSIDSTYIHIVKVKKRKRYISRRRLTHHLKSLFYTMGLRLSVCNNLSSPLSVWFRYFYMYLFPRF